MPPSPSAIPPVVPVFPLPEVVLFPRVVIPLHIFEPRYRAMVADVLSGEPVIAIALLKAGYEALYTTSHAPIHPVVGVGRVVVSEQLENGTYNLLLRGEARARVIEDVDGKPYRRARIATLEPAAADDHELERLRESLRKAVEGFTAAERDVQQHWRNLFETALAAGDVADVIASGLQVDAELRQCLLAEAAPVSRINLLLDVLRAQQAVATQRRSLGSAPDVNLN